MHRERMENILTPKKKVGSTLRLVEPALANSYI